MIATRQLADGRHEILPSDALRHTAERLVRGDQTGHFLSVRGLWELFGSDPFCQCLS
jgi:hypothetical protein